ncbi:MAG TPA: glycosyltransferase family 39 protein [Solirubrobacteraceae bacterium]|nr:glycosyltransferase family 39 protein [Solirubrobacteraceae bacterium]
MLEVATMTRSQHPPRGASPPAGRASLPRPRLHVDPIPLAVAALLIATLVLRLWGIKQGLPYIYNVDEESHFVPKAITFFGHSLNPNYFLNPPAYSYALNIVFELWFGSRDAVSHTFATNPTEVYVVARVVASVLGTVAVWLTYLTGKRLFGRGAGLVAAAIFGFAFLPIFYSHLALNDVPTLAPVALSLYGVAGVLRYGRLADYVVAGIGIGLAAATKYTGGITLLCLFAAAASGAAGGEHRHVPRRLLAGLGAALVAFVIANPYALLDFSSFINGVKQQASETDAAKLGSSPVGGIDYYLWTFTWGIGWAPAVASVVGAVLLVVRRKLALALVLIPAPIVFIIFMGEQGRYFGRWLMPILPIVAILAGYAAVELIRFISRARAVRPFAAALVAVLLLAQSVTAVVHNDEVLSRPDTINTARAWMVNHIPAAAKIVVEPMIPANWVYDPGRSLIATPSGERWRLFNTAITNIDTNYHALAPGVYRLVAPDQYESTLRPHLLHLYEANGFCWVVVSSLQAGRAYVNPTVPEAIAYYRALDKYGKLMFHISPYSPGASAVPFNFDWSIDYYPRQYRLPGPEISVYKLHGGKCTA